MAGGKGATILHIPAQSVRLEEAGTLDIRGAGALPLLKGSIEAGGRPVICHAVIDDAGILDQTRLVVRAGGGLALSSGNPGSGFTPGAEGSRVLEFTIDEQDVVMAWTDYRPLRERGFRSGRASSSLGPMDFEEFAGALHFRAGTALAPT